MGRHSAVADTPVADFTAPPIQSVRWMFKLSDDEQAEWSWDEWGAPPLEELRPVREPRSSENNRHIPVTAYSMLRSAPVRHHVDVVRGCSGPIKHESGLGHAP